MVRNYQRKPGSRKYRDYDEEKLQEAVARYNRRNLRALSEEYGIPYVTLYRKVRGMNPKKPGGQAVLTEEEEASLVRGIVVAADWGFPFGADDVKEIVKTHLERKGKTITKFKNNTPGQTWVENFLKRHKNELSKRFSQSIKESRAKVDHTTINQYFDNISETFQDIPPENIINYDETNFTDDPGRIKVLVRRKSKRAEKVMDSSKSATSVMFACTASGLLLPLYVVYKADHLWTTWCENGPTDARYNRSHSGWFDTNIFEDWFKNIILPYCKKLQPGPKILIGDNLASHISFNVITQCEENNIRFILLPPNSTHMTQPLDVSVFRPVKGAWREILRAWKKHNKGVIRKDIFPRLLNQALIKINAANSKNITSGFEATGLVPVNRHKVLDKLPKVERENDQQTDMIESLKDVFVKARFSSEKTPRVRKKKLNVEAGKSISLKDLEIPSTSSAETKKSVKAKKQNKKPVLYDSSSESDIDETVLTVDDDDDELETFSDYEDEENNMNLDNISDENLDDSSKIEVNDFVLVNMKTEKKKFVYNM